MPSEVEDKFEFYPARVDDRPASIFINLAYNDIAPIPSATEAYCVFIQIREPGDHGMGSSAEESLQLNDLEDQINELAINLGLYPIGRLRNNGVWQPCYMGPPDIDFESSVSDLVKKSTGHEVGFGGKHDPEWKYYSEFLYPDAERWQWIMNRRTVDHFADNGDRLTPPRRVDHWAYFPNRGSRTRFTNVAIGLGFAVESSWREKEATNGKAWAVQIFRTDSIELGHIHDVVMELVRAAEAQGGEYDGWEAPILQLTPSGSLVHLL